MEGGMFGEVGERKLCDAAARGELMTFQKLLQQDPLLLNRASHTCSKKTPLHVATSKGNVSIVEEILRRNPELAEELDSQQSSALHTASAKGNVEIAGKLLAAAPEACLWRDGQGRNPLHLAAMQGHVEVVQLLLRGAPLAATEMSLWRDCQGRNPLHLAAMQGHVEVVRLLLRQAPLAAREGLDRGQTVLHLCVKHGRVDALKVLVPELGDLVCARDDDGEIISHLAVRYKQVEVVRFLVEKRCMKMNATNSSGQTPLRILKRSRSASPDDTASETITKILQQACSINGCATDRSRRQVEWLKKKRETIMVVAILIATVAFQAGVSPAGGVWQGSLNDPNNTTASTPPDGNNIPASTPAGRQPNEGEAVMATRHPKIYRNFVRFNTTAFVLSLSTILLLVSGLPFKKGPLMWVLMITMWAAITCMAVAYAASIMAVTPNYKEYLRNVIATGIYAWSAVMGILLVGNSLRLLNRWLMGEGTILRPLQRLRKLLGAEHDVKGNCNQEYTVSSVHCDQEDTVSSIQIRT